MKYIKYIATAGAIFASTLALNAITLHAQTANPSYCPDGPIPSISATLSLVPSVQECSSWTGCETINNAFYATFDTANTLASALGATVVTVTNPLGDPAFTFSSPEYELLFPNGYEPNAGYIAWEYNNGLLPAFGSTLLQGICGTGIGSGTGGTGGVTTGGGTGSTGGTGVTITSIFSGLDTITSALNNTCASSTNLVMPVINTDGTVSGTSGNTSICSILDQINSTINNLKTTVNNTTGSNIATLTNTSNLSGANIATGGVKTVTVTLLNDRSAANTSASIVKQLKLGDQITVNSSVTGESVEGVSVWWQLTDGTFIWSGGTTR